MEITLTRGFVATVDSEDADLAAFKWHAEIKHRPANTAYAIRTLGKSHKPNKVRLHRLIMERVLGRQLSSGEIVDHKDGNTMNNCRANLRLTDTFGNAQNRHKTHGKTRGVYLLMAKPRWIARLKCNGKYIYVGSFKTQAEAQAAYEQAVKDHFGEFSPFK